MVVLTPPSVNVSWQKYRFASTLYLQPILDCLLSNIPKVWEAEIRLGLQEALVNASKHGNKLDPQKTVQVKFAQSSTRCWWIITDEGRGFTPPHLCPIPSLIETMPGEHCECGRGLYILYRIFDHVDWNQQGTELRLCKDLRSS